MGNDFGAGNRGKEQYQTENSSSRLGNTVVVAKLGTSC
jgi:hypothetical protein